MHYTPDCYGASLCKELGIPVPEHHNPSKGGATHSLNLQRHNSRFPDQPDFHALSVCDACAQALAVPALVGGWDLTVKRYR